jgi:hypothetical protein
MLIIFDYLEVREAKLIYILRLFNRKICNMYLEDYPTIEEILDQWIFSKRGKNYYEQHFH